MTPVMLSPVRLRDGLLVLLGMSAVRPDGRLALFSGCALAGYGAGALIAAPRRLAGAR